jgi:superfamily II DNA or RNA helicase
VLMYHGDVRPVEDIRVGDKLIGPDSRERVVVSTVTGREMLYRITPSKGMPYVVNESHILSLKASCGQDGIRHKGQLYQQNDVINISVRDYLKERNAFRHSTLGWRAPVTTWNQKPHPDMPPYILGLWLGDGSTGCPAFTTEDHEIVRALRDWAPTVGLIADEKSYDGKCPMIRLRGIKQGWFANRMVSSLKALGVYRAKAIPTRYKFASTEDRLQLLAGLIDTDGSLMNKCYDFISMYQHLSDDVAFIARSVGLAAYVRPCEKRCQNGNGGTYYRVCISGDIDRIPCRIARKKATKRRSCKNVLHVGIKVEAIGVGQYFGFTLDGPDHLFLLGDFTVTHNTTLFAALAERFHARGFKTLVLENRDKLVRQTADRIHKETGIDVDVEMGSDHASPFAPIVVASVQTLGRVNRLTGFASDHFGLIVVDECHFSLADQFQRVMAYFHYGPDSLAEEWERPEDGTYQPVAKIAAFTATPDIGERRSLMDYYQYRSVNYSYLEAIEEGWLVRAVQESIPIKIDLRKYKAGSTPMGMDLKKADLEEAIIPIIEKLADQIVERAADRKTMAFLPSVQCAQMMADAIERRGLRSIFVSGECFDADEKANAFHAAGPGTVLCNAVIYAFGVDFPDVDCIAWFRATQSKAFYIQGLYRGSRVLPGVIDGLTTAEERKEAIAASAKPYFLVLDPLFVHDRIDLCDTYDLYTEKREVKEQMKAEGPPTPEAAEKAERDFIAALEKEAKKHARKQARTIDPVAWAVSIGDEVIANYVPQEQWEMREPSQPQIEFFQKNRIDYSKIKYRGLATKIIGRYVARLKMKLATAEQLSFLKQLGMNDQEAAKLNSRDAGKLIDAALAQKRAARSSAA